MPSRQPNDALHVSLLLHSLHPACGLVDLAQIEDLYATEAQSACLAYGRETTLQNRAPAALAETAVDGQRAQVGRQTPDVMEGNAGEVQAPAQRQTAAEDGGEAFVAAVLAALIKRSESLQIFSTLLSSLKYLVPWIGSPF